MLKVPQQEYIKYLREFEDLSISEIKENLGVNWRTAKKYADKDNWNKPLVRASRVSPVMDDYKDIVDTWLSDDQLISKKQRSVTHSQFAKMLPKELRDYICIEDMDNRRERIAACISWLQVYKINEINECLERFKDNSTVSMITSMLHIMNGHSYSYRNDLDEKYTPKEIKGSETSLNKYDLLSKAGVING